MTEADIKGAENRVKEMNRMARQYLEQSNRAMRQNRSSRQNTRFEPVQNVPPPVPEPPPPAHEPHPPEPMVSRKESPLESLLNPDSEKILIILLIIVLLKEKADFRIIAALGYLLI